MDMRKKIEETSKKTRCDFFPRMDIQARILGEEEDRGDEQER